jgi:GTP-binding protein EngB required for normal cell division
MLIPTRPSLVIFYDIYSSVDHRLNTQIPILEIAVIGPKASGKSSIIEALLGRVSNAVHLGGATKRPLFLQLINNVECEQPRVTIKRDPFLREFDHDIEVS